jgi:3-isopropylmalate dehydratase small subunit
LHGRTNGRFRCCRSYIEREKGRDFVFGHNLDTDQIYAGRYLELTDAEDFGRHGEAGNQNFEAGKRKIRAKEKGLSCVLLK